MKNDGSTLIANVSREITQYKVSDIGKIRSVFEKVTKESKGNITYVSIADTNMKVSISSDISNVITEEKTSGFIFKTASGQKVYNVSTPFYEESKLVGTINIGISLENMYKLIGKGLMETLLLSSRV